LIFVTVGSSAPFDDLVMAVDRLAGRGTVADRVISQIGEGAYIPKNGEWFRFKDDLAECYRAADIVVTHTGAGTLFELVREGKKAIAVPNPHVVQNHDIADRLSRDGYILFCQDLDGLEARLAQIKSWEPRKYVEEACLIADTIASYLLNDQR